MNKTVKVGDIFDKYENPMAEVVYLACTFESKVTAECGSRKINLKSIMGVMAFGWEEDMEVSVEAEGEDAKAAVDAIVDFLKA